MWLSDAYMNNQADFSVANGTGEAFENVAASVTTWHTNNLKVIASLNADL